MRKTVKFLETFRNLYQTFSIYEKRENMRCTPWKTLKKFESSVESYLLQAGCSLNDTHNLVSTKSLILFEMTKWTLAHLKICT